MFVVATFREILLPSLNILVHDVINPLYYLLVHLEHLPNLRKMEPISRLISMLQTTSSLCDHVNLVKSFKSYRSDSVQLVSGAVTVTKTI